MRIMHIQFWPLSLRPPSRPSVARSLQAMRVMETRKIRHLPVYDGETLLGMLSIKDIISTFIGQHETDVSSMSSYIAGNTY